MLPEFAKWPSIQRLSSEICWITEKIDGTNGVIYVPDDASSPIIAGSRERWLSNEDGTPPIKGQDNYGFAAWVYDRRESLRRLGPGTHYGEFHGAGIQRKYCLPDKRFASFEYWRSDIAIPGVCVVPILYTGEPYEGVIKNTVDALIDGGSRLYPGFMKPEGVVVTYKNMNHCKFKRLCENDKIHKRQLAAPNVSDHRADAQGESK
jgi:hypothetical protein